MAGEMGRDPSRLSVEQQEGLLRQHRTVRLAQQRAQRCGGGKALSLPDAAHSQGSLGLLPSMPWAFIEGAELWRLHREALFVLKRLQPPDPRAWQGPSRDAVG